MPKSTEGVGEDHRPSRRRLMRGSKAEVDVIAKPHGGLHVPVLNLGRTDW